MSRGARVAYSQRRGRLGGSAGNGQTRGDPSTATRGRSSDAERHAPVCTPLERHRGGWPCHACRRRRSLLDSSTTIKDAYFEAKCSNEGFYNFAFQAPRAPCRHPLLFGDAADKAT